MGYLHISNLYKDQRVRDFDECLFKRRLVAALTDAEPANA